MLPFLTKNTGNILSSSFCNLKADILSFENYEEDTNKYFKLNQKIPERNVSNKSKKDYRDFYTKQTIQIIADWYKKDIDYFGFDFDTGATKSLWN